MDELIQHFFLCNPVKLDGPLILVIPELPDNPTTRVSSLLVKQDEPTAYLQRGGEDNVILDAIAPAFIDKLRAAQNVWVVEVKSGCALDPFNEETRKREYVANILLMECPPIGAKPVKAYQA